MKIALIGDVHANLPALEAVLTHAHQQGIEAIWNVGDWVGYNAFPNEALTPNTPEARLCELAQIARAEVIVCGHSHRPFTRQVEGVWFINTGSVGRPDDGDPRAAYAILQIEAEFLQISHHRLEYDVDRAVEVIRHHNLPEAFGQMLRQGRNLDEVLPV